MGAQWWLVRDNALLLDMQSQRAALQTHIQALPKAAVAPPDFVQALPASSRVDDVSRDIGQFAKGLDVRVVSMAIDPQPLSTTELGKVQFNVSALADYKSAKSWLGELLGRYPSLGIQSMAVRASPTDMGRQEIRVVLVLYVKD